MLSNIITSSAAALLALTSSAAAFPQNMARRTPEASLTAQLTLADSAIDRYNLLTDDDFVFDFSKSLGMANRKTFPALVGTNGALAAGAIPACGMSTVHIHPRSAELFVVLSGRMLTELVPEAGVLGDDGKQRVIRTELGANQMTVFPIGSFHTQVNPDCEPALAVASFTSEDPGTSFIAAQTFALRNETIVNTFGGSIAGEDIDLIRNSIPESAVFIIEECLSKCGLQKRKI